MKYISRITALLLVLMMLTPTFASALTLSTATQGDLDKLYQEATDSGYEYYPTGYLGFWGGVDAFDTLTNKDAYTFQWYDAEGNALQSYSEDAPEKLRFVYTMETQYFHCVATPVNGGAAITSAIKVIPPADISNADDYLAMLCDARFQDALGAIDTLTIYRMMTGIWNVTMPNGKNLAENILALWWSERGETYFIPDLFCSCVVSGEVAADECVLHPNSNLHVDGCAWAQYEISANVGISTPESLLMLENVVLAAEARSDVDAYTWQTYVYDPAFVGMRWAVANYVQDTNLYTIQVNKESVQTAYRVVIETTDYDLYESKPLYLGGYDFFNWILTTDGIQEWMADESVTLDDVVARYNEHLAAADEEDRTNAEDYTYGEEGESVNLKVPQGTFAEDYVMEIAPATLSDATINAVLQSMDATGIAQMQVLTAFDIAFAALADRTRKLQPAEGTSVALTFEVDTTGIDEALKYLYVYHIANDGTPEVVAGPVEVTFGVQPIPVQAEGFSTYLAMATSDACIYCQNHEYCFYEELMAMTHEAQYTYLAGLNGNYADYMSDYVRHITAGAPAILCTCVDYTGDEPERPNAPLGDNHSTTCPWSDTAPYYIGILGSKIGLNPGQYSTYKWYLGNTNGDPISTESIYKATFTKDAELYICVVDNGSSEFWYRVQADLTTIYQYKEYLANQDEFWIEDYERNRLAIYKMMTTNWNVSIDDDENADNNLAKAVLVYWKYNYIEGLDDDLLCTCCIGEGNIVSDQIMLHPDALHDETCPWYTEVEVIIPPSPEQPPLYNGNPNGAQYTSNETYSLPMADDRAVILPKGGRASIRSNQASGAQWQVSDGTQWIDIQGETAADIVVTDAKLNTIFELTGIAQLRYFDKTNNVVLASVSVTSQEIAGGDYPELTAQTRELIAMPRAAWESIPDSDDTTNTVTINYVLNDTVIRANMVGQYGADQETVTFSVASPEVVGYKPFIYDYDDEGNLTAEEADVIEYDGPLDGDRVYTVVYEPDYVKYTIRYMLQDLYDPDVYIENNKLSKEITTKKTGDIASLTAADKMDIDGFYYIMNTDNAEIVATGTTTLEIYYNRAYYLMKFELDGGYGVEPIYAPYQAPITVGAPEKTGYTFTGWTPTTVPSTMPLNGGAYTATWAAQNVNYTVVFWYENADNTKYSQVGMLTNQSALAGSTVNGADFRNYNFGTSRDTTHFTYSHADSNVVVNGDGTTVVNVYYSRNTYTLTFQVQINRRWTTVKTISEKYEAKIYNQFPIIGTNGTNYSGWDWDDQGNTYEYVLQTLDEMPGTNVTFRGSNRGTDCVIYYFVEIVNGEDTTGLTTRTRNGKTYKLMKAVEHSFNYITYSEEYHPIDGYSRNQQTGADPAFGTYNNNSNAAKLGDSGTGYNNTRYDHINYLYYDRLTYVLQFSNAGSIVAGRGGNVQYEAPLQSYNFTPDYPTGWEKGAYVFEGWYYAPTYGDTKVDFATDKMPASDVTVYARWIHATHNVNIYKTSALNAADKIGETQVVEHGAKATAPAQPTHPEYRDYEFVDWFYMDNGTEKAFNFENMTVRKDMDVYAKWSSTTLVDYTIRYVDKNTGEEIAPATKRTGLAGTNPEVFPKPSDELDEGYQEGWFPEIVSDTIELSSARENVYTFYYINRGKVPYTVYYLAADPLETTTILGTKVVNGVEYKIIAATENKETSNIAVTETAKNIPQYLPTKYQETLIIGGATGAVNEICFFYNVNKDSAYGSITHYIEDDEGEYTDKAGKKWSKYTQRFESGKVGNTLSATSISIQDYTYDPTAVDQVLEGKLTIDPMLELKVFYTENEVLINYAVVCPAGAEEACKVSRPSEYVKVRTGDAKGSTASTTSEAYEFVGWFETPYGTDEALTNNAYYQPQKVGIKHVAKTYYARFVEKEATITYVPVGNGTVSQTSETLKVLSGVATGSVAIAAENHHFVGWYDNEACKGEALSTDVGYVPVKPGTMWEDARYYAKFEENEVTITYIPVGPNGANDGAGTVTPTSETLKVATDEAQGSTAAASSNTYTFVGWYSDVSCADDKWLSSDAKYVPSKVDGLNVAATYYAKFEYNVSNLTITKDGMSNGESAIVEVVITTKDGTAKDAQTYTIVFNDNVKSVTISNVLIGSTYEVTEQTAWSWRYTLGSPVYTTPSKTIVADANQNLVTITNEHTNDKWLSDESAVENNLGTGQPKGLNNQ